MKKMVPALAIAALLGGCIEESSDQKQNRAQEQMNMQAVNAVGMPAITNYAEKRALKEILELRDRAVSTYTYYLDLQGNLHFLCHSVGFGISAATQYTNPQKIDYSSHGVAVISQADPNGLYSPAASEGTYVLCLNPETKSPSPLYVEPRIIVSQWDLTKKTN